MFDTRKIAAYICNLRKDRDITQMELAEKLNVSHQAVSKWERGESMPDIGMLPKLAEIFSVSIDSILNGEEKRNNINNRHIYTEGQLISEVSKGNVEKIGELLKGNELEIETVINVAPILKTSTINKIAETVPKNVINIPHIVDLAPFIGKETLDHLLKDTLEAGHNINVAIIEELAPFLHTETTSSLISRVDEEEFTLDTIAALAPFLQRDIIDRMVNKAIKDEVKIEQLESLAPFVSKDTVIKIIELVNEELINLDTIASLAPFIGEACLDELINRIEEEIEPRHLRRLAPFMKKETLTRLFKRLDKNRVDLELLVELAPFIGKELLEGYIVKQTCEKK